MFSLRLMRLVAGFAPLSAASIPGAVTANVRAAYVPIEAKQGQMEAALQSLSSLGNCLAMTHSFRNDEIVAHLECDGPNYLSLAIADAVSKSKAVARVTVLAVLTSQ